MIIIFFKTVFGLEVFLIVLNYSITYYYLSDVSSINYLVSSSSSLCSFS